MKKIYYVFILITLLSVSACMKSVKEDQFSDDSLSSVLKIAVQMPQGFNYTTQGLTISLSDPSSGLKFSGVTDNSGVATIRVAHGTYIATTQVSHSESGGVIYIFNGTTEKIRVTPKDPALINTNLSLNVSKAGQIVIKEFYYGGCFDVATNKSYSKDQYFILYNNTGETAYLDSLCVGIIDPYNAPTSGKTSQWVKKGSTEIRDSLPATGMGWMFPGTGKDNPLPPGGQIVVSLNAINHKATVSASVDLGKTGYWAIYDAIMTKNQSVPNAGVNLLKGFWKVGTATSYVVSTLSPGLFIYSLGGKTTDQFVQSTYTWNPSYPSNRNFDCLMVDKNLILDGVECFRNTTDSKRFRPEVDNGFAITDGSGQGQSIHRKVDPIATAAAGGRIVYMDTNNSSVDFEKRAKASLTNN